MVLWIWRGFGVRVPEAWEMLQYSFKPETGRCVFADRERFRFEMSWRRVPGAPDFERVISDYLAKLKDQGMEKGRRIESAGLQGIEGVINGALITRYGTFASAASAFVELVFPWPGARDEELEHQVLESFEELVPDTSGMQRWRAFGLDVRVPAALALESCRVDPALVQWRFADARARRSLQVARRGMVAQWLHEPVRDWLDGQVKLHGRAPVRRWQSREHGHDVMHIEGRTVPRGWGRRSFPLRAAAWRCPEDGRLYDWVAEGEGDVLANSTLCCCGGC
jgi:hypothetical protein